VFPAPDGERERGIEVLRAAGLLAEPSPEMLALAAQSTATLEEVQAAFARAGGKLLNEIVLEQRMAVLIWSIMSASPLVNKSTTATLVIAMARWIPKPRNGNISVS
jgi:hypothetical protein